LEKRKKLPIEKDASFLLDNLCTSSSAGQKKLSENFLVLVGFIKKGRKGRREDFFLISLKLQILNQTRDKKILDKILFSLQFLEAQQDKNGGH
jgi:hypothetical protein